MSHGMAKEFIIDGMVYETAEGRPEIGNKLVVTKVNENDVEPTVVEVIGVSDSLFRIMPKINYECDLSITEKEYDEYYVVTSAKSVHDVSVEKWAEEQAQAPASDSVEKPSHYTAGSIEVIDIIAQTVAGYDDPFVAHCVGTATKYLNRAPYKHDTPTEDLRKAARYIAFAIEHLAEKSEGGVDE